MQQFPNPLDLLHVSIWKNKSALDIQGDQDHEVSKLLQKPSGQKKDLSSPRCPLIKCQNWSLKVTFLCPPADFSSSIDCDYFTSSVTAVEQLEESGWLDKAVCPMTPDISRAVISSEQGRKAGKLFKYFCFVLMCFTFIWGCEYSASLLCWTESEQIYHRGRYGWPALLFHPQHSHALSKAKP